FTAGSGNTSGTFAWTPGFDAAPGPYTVTFTAQNALSGSSSTAITVTNVDRAPQVIAPATATASQAQALTLTVTASDPDGEAITALNASGLPSGATFTPNGSYTSGTLDWTPASDAGRGPYVVTCTAQNALSGTASTSITVQ